MKKSNSKKKYQTIIDRETLMQLNAEGCPICSKKFTLGEPVVLACGGWEGPMKLIHENEAAFDPAIDRYVDRRCLRAK